MKNSKSYKPKFIDYFIAKEQKFLFKISPSAFLDEDFKFYISWFIYAIDDYMKEKYDIQKHFAHIFNENIQLNTIFFNYIIHSEFIPKVQQRIIEYKQRYNTDNIYD